MKDRPAFKKSLMTYLAIFVLILLSFVALYLIGGLPLVLKISEFLDAHLSQFIVTVIGIFTIAIIAMIGSVILGILIYLGKIVQLKMKALMEALDE